jgi:ankyrin repeat protein
MGYDILPSYQPLHVAASYGLEEIVRTTIARKENLNARDDDEQTPLFHAVFCDRDRVVKLLIEQPEVDVNVKNERQAPALIHATGRNNVRILEAFFGRDELLLNSVNEYGDSTLGLALNNKSTKAENET